MDGGDSKGRKADVIRRLHGWKKGTNTLDKQNKVMTLITYNMLKIYLERLLWSALSLRERG